MTCAKAPCAASAKATTQQYFTDRFMPCMSWWRSEIASAFSFTSRGTRGPIGMLSGFCHGRDNGISRLLIDHLPGPDGGGNPGEIADICNGVAIKDHEIGIEAGFQPALLRGLEIVRGIGGERGQHLAFRQRAAHQLVFECGVVEL